MSILLLTNIGKCVVLIYICIRKKSNKIIMELNMNLCTIQVALVQVL